MAHRNDIDEPPGEGSRYFFLSYAHSAPLEGESDVEPDHLVHRFFTDLATAVDRHPMRRPGLQAGFFDQQIPVGSNWKERLSHALSAAQVFVPLYSPRYLAASWPWREFSYFRRCMKLAGLQDPEQRLLPVLWTPLADASEPPGMREALDLGQGEPDYAKNGLRALLKVLPYRRVYEIVVQRLAEHIVRVAGETALKPGTVPDIDQVPSVFMPTGHLADFAVEVAAPTTQKAPSGGSPGGYGASKTDWRPFPEQKLTLADYARQVAERFDFDVEVTEIEDSPGAAGTVTNPAERKPGIMLIDPWLVSDRHGRDALKCAVQDMPRWVLPLVVSDQLENRRTAELAQQVRTILSAAGALPTESSRRGAHGVGSLDAFVPIVRELVAEAERQYFRYGGEQPPPGHEIRKQSQRPRLGRRGRLAAPTPAADQAGEPSDG